MCCTWYHHITTSRPEREVAITFVTVHEFPNINLKLSHSISTLKAISVYAFNMYIKQNGTHKTLKEDEIADCNALLISSVVLDLHGDSSNMD